MRVVADHETLPYVPLSKERKDQLAKVMRRGNKALKHMYDQVVEIANIQRKFYSRADFRDELVDAMKKGVVSSIRGIKLDAKSLEKIQAVTDIRMEILCGYTRSIEKLAYRYASAHPEMILSFQDYYDEGIIGAINAMYYYTDTDIAFMTYLYHCVRRKLAGAVNKANPLSPWSNEARKLHMLYEEGRADFNRPATFDEVAAYLGFNENERAIVQATLTETYHATSMSSKHEGSATDGDSAVFETLFSDELRPVRERLDHDQRRAIQSTVLTHFEKAVLDAFQMGDRGWQSEVAAAHINPRTGKPYSRRFTRLALDSAIAKIQKTYEEQQSKRASA